MSKIGVKLLNQVDAMQRSAPLDHGVQHTLTWICGSYNDELEIQLMGELENARLVRLLCKFGFINERPQ